MNAKHDPACVFIFRPMTFVHINRGPGLKDLRHSRSLRPLGAFGLLRAFTRLLTGLIKPLRALCKALRSLVRHVRAAIKDSQGLKALKRPQGPKGSIPSKWNNGLGLED